MKNLLIVACLFLYSFSCIAQFEDRIESESTKELLKELNDLWDEGKLLDAHGQLAEWIETNEFNDLNSFDQSYLYYFKGELEYNLESDISIIESFQSALNIIDNEVSEYSYYIRQRIADAYYIKAQRDSAIIKYKECISIANAKWGEEHSNSYKMNARLARCYVNGTQNYNKVDSFLRISFNGLEIDNLLDSPDAIYSYFVDASNHHFSFKYEEAIKSFEKILLIADRHDIMGSNSNISATLFRLAEIHRYRSSFNKAIVYYKKHIENQKGNPYNRDVQNSKIKIAQCYMSLTDYAAAEEMLNIAETDVQSYSARRESLLILIYQQRAKLFGLQEDIGLAKNEYAKAVDLIKSSGKEESITHAICAGEYGQYLLGIGELDLAEEQIEQSLDIWRGTLGETNAHLSKYYFSLASIASENGDRVEFDSMSHMAYQSLSYSKGSYSFGGVTSYGALIDMIELECLDLISHDSANIGESLSFLYSEMDEYLELIDELFLQNKQNEFQEYFSNRSSRFINELVVYLSDYLVLHPSDTEALKRLYELIERSKDIPMLLSYTRSIRSQDNFENLKDLKFRIRQARKNGNDEELIHLLTEYNQSWTEEENLGFKFIQVPEIGELQSNYLENGQAAILYHQVENKFITLFLSEREFKHNQMQFPDILQDEIVKFKDEIVLNELKDENWEERAKKYYNYWVDDILSSNEFEYDRLIIIPDGILNGMAFEILGYAADKEILFSYASSISTLYQQSQRKSAATKLGVWIPDYTDASERPMYALRNATTRGEYGVLP